MSYRSWILAGVLCLPLAVGAGVTRIPAGASLVQPEALRINAAQVAADAAPVLASLARGDAARALALLRALPDAASFESTASHVIEQLQQRPATPATDVLLEALANEPIRLYQRHDETAGNWFVPVFDVPGRAQSARRLHARVLERDRLLPKLRQGDVRPLSVGASDPAALVAALELLTPTEAARLVARARPKGAALAPGAWSALARRAPEPDTLDAVLQFERPAEALALLQQLSGSLPPETTLAWLERALGYADYRSASVAAIGREAARSPLALQKLGELLGAADATTGASAAAALAQLPAALRLAEYDRVLAKSRDPKVLARIALALRLDDSPPARERLQRLSDDPRLSETVRKELQR